MRQTVGSGVSAVSRKRRGPLLYNLIRPRQQRRRDREAEGLGGLAVDDQPERGGLLDGQIAGLGGGDRNGLTAA